MNAATVTCLDVTAYDLLSCDLGTVNDPTSLSDGEQC